MAGLLDFLNTPAGMGLLSSVAGYAAGARRGTPINNIGRGLTTGLMGYQNANDQIRQDSDNAIAKQYKNMQMTQMQNTLDTQKAQQAWKAGLPGVMAPKLTGSTDQGRQLADQNAAFGKEGIPALVESAQYARPDAPINMDYGVDKQAAQDYMIQPDSPYADKMIEKQIMQPTDKPQLVTVYGSDGKPMQKWLRPGESTGVDIGMGKPEAVKSTWQDGGDKLYEMDGQGKPTGNTLPKALAPNMQFVQGNDYKPSGVFNPRTGGFTPNDAPEQAPDVRPDPMSPWNGLPPKKADDMRKQLYATESKKLDDLREQVDKGRGLMIDLDRFGELNRNTVTGGVVDRSERVPTFNDDKQEMKAISARLAPAARPSGSGATSDRDIGLYLQGLPGIDKHGTVNKNIRESYVKSVEGADKAMGFAERYFADKGHLNGWQAAYKASQGEKPPKTVKDLPGKKTATNTDIQATVRASGKTEAEVIAAFRAKGYILK